MIDSGHYIVLEKTELIFLMDGVEMEKASKEEVLKLNEENINNYNSKVFFYSMLIYSIPLITWYFYLFDGNKEGAIWVWRIVSLIVMFIIWRGVKSFVSSLIYKSNHKKYCLEETEDSIFCVTDDYQYAIDKKLNHLTFKNDKGTTIFQGIPKSFRALDKSRSVSYNATVGTGRATSGESVTLTAPSSYTVGGTEYYIDDVKVPLWRSHKDSFDEIVRLQLKIDNPTFNFVGLKVFEFKFNEKKGFGDLSDVLALSNKNELYYKNDKIKWQGSIRNLTFRTDGQFQFEKGYLFTGAVGVSSAEIELESRWVKNDEEFRKIENIFFEAYKELTDADLSQLSNRYLTGKTFWSYRYKLYSVGVSQCIAMDTSGKILLVDSDGHWAGEVNQTKCSVSGIKILIEVDDPSYREKNIANRRFCLEINNDVERAEWLDRLQHNRS